MTDTGRATEGRYRGLGTYAGLRRERLPDVMVNGGSCIAAPDATWLVEPVADEERLIVATIEHHRVR